MQKRKMAVWGGLTNSYEKKRSESKGEKEKYKHLNAEFQRLARRDKKAFFRYQCKEMTNLDSILRGRDISLPRSVCLVKSVVFPVVMYGC